MEPLDSLEPSDLKDLLDLLETKVSKENLDKMPNIWLDSRVSRENKDLPVPSETSELLEKKDLLDNLEKKVQEEDLESMERTELLENPESLERVETSDSMPNTVLALPDPMPLSEVTLEAMLILNLLLEATSVFKFLSSK